MSRARRVLGPGRVGLEILCSGRAETGLAGNTSEWPGVAYPQIRPRGASAVGTRHGISPPGSAQPSPSAALTDVLRVEPLGDGNDQSCLLLRSSWAKKCFCIAGVSQMFSGC